MFEDMAPSLAARLQATSYALGLDQSLLEIADVVYDMDAAGASERDINRRIHAWMNEHGLGYETWREEVSEALGGPPDLRQARPQQGLARVRRGAVASGVHPLARLHRGAHARSFPSRAAFWFEDDTQDPPLLIAVLTPLIRPRSRRQAAQGEAPQDVRQAGLGSPAQRRGLQRSDARQAQRAGMSYNEIAIQNLREEHPDIVRNPHRYKAELKTERERVAKAVRAAERLWKERGLDSSIAD